MKVQLRMRLAAVGGAIVVGLCMSSGAFAVDAAAAETLAKQSGCLKCHAVAKKKDGPAYRDVAA
ncbi:MAG TPA: hypothetical protein VET48_09205, partial [Steroidobacteraceae bacterium]|nr:hypothetical protein [Steroidobacteraceae bacterium]